MTMMTAKLTMENNMNRYSVLNVVENKQMSATSAVAAAPQPIMGRNAMMKISTQDTAIVKATFRGSAKVGYRKGRVNARYLSRLISVRLKLDAPKRNTVNGITTRHGINGLLSVWLSWSARRSGMAMAPWSMSATARLRKRKLYTVRSLLFHRIATMTKKFPITATTETVIIKMDVKIISGEYEAIFSWTFLSCELQFWFFLFFVECFQPWVKQLSSVFYDCGCIFIVQVTFPL